MQLSSSMRFMARRMLGLGGRTEAHRNSYLGWYPVPCLDALVAMGGAVRTDSLSRRMQWRVGYTLTRAGAEAVLRPGESLDAIYFPEEETY
jgi:hypothetical protein